MIRYIFAYLLIILGMASAIASGIIGTLDGLYYAAPFSLGGAIGACYGFDMLIQIERSRGIKNG